MKLPRRWLAAVALGGRRGAGPPSRRGASLNRSLSAANRSAGHSRRQQHAVGDPDDLGVRNRSAWRTSLADWYLSREGAPQFEEPGPARAVHRERLGPASRRRSSSSAPVNKVTVRFTLTVPQRLLKYGRLPHELAV